MTIALLVVTDGREDYLARTIASARDNLQGNISERWMFDDSGDEHHRHRLAARYPEFLHINAGPRRGFGGAIASAWSHLLAQSVALFVFHLEQDFTFNHPVDLDDLAAVLGANPELVQLALRRQPWNEEERAAGGIVELHPEDYRDCRAAAGSAWLETRRNFTTNPSLYRRSLCAEGWPAGEQSEGRFGIGLLQRHPDWRFGYWGARDSGERVTHIGAERVGVGY